MKLYKLELIDKSKELVIHKALVNETLAKQVKSKLENVIEVINPNLALEINLHDVTDIMAKNIVETIVKQAINYTNPKSK